MRFFGMHIWTMTAAIALSAIAGAAKADSISVGAENTGWYASTGKHVLSNLNYIAGNSGSPEYHDYFVFDLSGVTGNITSASLVVNTYIVGGTPTLTLHSVDDAASAVETSTWSMSIFNHLASGALYGTRAYSSADNNSFQTIGLSSAAVLNLNVAKGNKFVIGGEAGNNSNSYVYGFSGGVPAADARLLLTITPAPLPTSMLGGAALLSLLAIRFLPRKSIFA